MWCFRSNHVEFAQKIALRKQLMDLMLAVLHLWLLKKLSTEILCIRLVLHFVCLQTLTMYDMQGLSAAKNRSVQFEDGLINH